MDFKNVQSTLLNRFNSVLVCILFSSFIVSCVSKKTIPANDILGHAPKQVRNIFKGFRFVDSTHFVTGSNSYMKPTENDSTLLVCNYLRIGTVSSPIYILDHEVTNAEYKEFINWVTDSIALSLIANKNSSYYLDRDKKILDWKKRSTIWTDSNRTFLDSLYYHGNVRYYSGRQQLDTRKLIYKYFDGRDTIIIPVYPDTTIWVTEFRYAYNDPFTRVYFSHPAYHNYPVIGVSWQQANAYCHWKTERLKENWAKNKIKNIPKKIKYRLPTEIEWEYSAYGYNLQSLKENIDNKRIYPWVGFSLLDKNGKYLANFGNIKDQNMIGIKYYGEDGGDYTTQVKLYPSNPNKIYDMAGNVAEWTSDIPERRSLIINSYFIYRGRVFKDEKAMIEQNRYYDSLDSVINKAIDSFRITAADSLPSAIEKIVALDNYIGERGIDIPYGLTWWGSNDRKWIEQFAANELHDAKVLAAHPNLRIIKGGSWATGPAYMLCSSREVFPENKCSSRIGFRLVLDIGK